uniref:Uncharacterized protein n=1 Tax=Medicago truncatula TaxID=3880 RepID=I3S7D6_MEDTR|nr:unknown [Medicago truncatula]
MYGTSSFLAIPTGFLAQCERGIHDAITTDTTRNQKTPFIFPTRSASWLQSQRVQTR